MKRREFLALAGGATAWPLAVRAQSGKPPTIGFLGASSPTNWSAYVTAFVRRLHELGWVEGRTVAIEYRWADGRSDLYEAFAAEFVRLKVDVIVSSGAAIPAARRETSAIPVVFAQATDPVGSGLVASLARPGGNVTGLSEQATDLAAKRLEILRELFPGLRRLAVIGNPGYRAVVLEMGELESAARTLGLELARMEVRRAEDVAPGFEALKGRADALYVAGDPLIGSNIGRIGAMAIAARLPAISSRREHVRAGVFLSYGPNYPDMFRRSAEYVDKILRGTKPAEIPVEQPTKFELVINLKTAEALGLTIPPALLARADEVIE